MDFNDFLQSKVKEPFSGPDDITVHAGDVVKYKKDGSLFLVTFNINTGDFYFVNETCNVSLASRYYEWDQDVTYKKTGSLYYKWDQDPVIAKFLGVVFGDYNQLVLKAELWEKV